MLKKLFLIGLCIAMAWCFVACHADLKDSECYFYKINELIKDEDFDTAKVNSEKIQLYDAQQNLIRDLPFDGYDKSVKFLYARKEGSVIFFVTGGAVDDEWGILFVNGETIPVNALDGIHSIKRLGGNSYQFDTAK